MATKIDRKEALEALTRHLNETQSDKYADDSNPVDIQRWLIGAESVGIHCFSISKYLHRVRGTKGNKTGNPEDCLKIADHALMLYAVLKDKELSKPKQTETSESPNMPENDMQMDFSLYKNYPNELTKGVFDGILNSEVYKYAKSKLALESNPNTENGNQS